MRFACSRKGRWLASLLILAIPCGAMEGAVAAEERVVQNVPGPAPAKISLQFQDVDIVEILKLLAEQAGFNLVAGRNVNGKVTLFVKDVDPWEALEVILAANELAYERRGQILTIMTQRDYELLHGMPYQDRRVLKSRVLRYAKAADVSRSLSQVKSNIGRVIADEATSTLILMDTPDLVEQMDKLAQQMDQPIETRVFSFNYGAVKTLGPILQEAVTKGVGRVSIDERTNQVAISDYPNRLKELAKMIEAFDERSTEVLIDAKILQVTLSDKFQLGIDWELLARENVDIKGPNALNLTSGLIVKVAQASITKQGDYKTLVEALRTFGDTKILSEPRLTVVNNQEAKILVGSKEPYVTNTISQAGTGTAVTAESVTFLDVGIKMFVTPTIARDHFVQMKIRPEVSTKTGTLTTSQKNEIPIVETAEAETVLLVEDGGTVILGGLIKDENARDQQRIPILGDIPILGIPFRSTKKTVKKTELVVFLTPHIITGGRGEAAAAAGKESSQRLDQSSYQALLLQRIQAIAQLQSLVEKAKGKATVEFTLSPDGRLRGSPRVAKAEEEDLRRLAQQAVLAASPFPPFPSSDWKKEPKTFQVSLDYE